VFGIAAGAANNFVTFCAMIACCGFGVGGNMPVDGTMFLEFLPGSHQYLLTLLSVWWAVGQVVASLIAWGFLARWGCETPAAGTFCKKEDNMGWRYTYYTLGAMMLFLWAVRFFVLPVYESPKFLASIGKDHEAVEVIHKMAKRNGKTVELTVDDLYRAAAPHLTADEKLAQENDRSATTKFSTWELVKNSFDNLSADHVTALFSTKRLAWSTTLITFCYAALGLAYPLYNGFLGTYLAQKNAELGNMNLNDTYASYTYQAACGIPGSIVAAFMVDWSRSGRKVAMAVFTLCAGIFLFGLTASRTQVQVNALTSMAAFFENAFYGVLYGYAPELFPTPSRGTGDAICSAASRITGLFAPIIAVYSKAALTPNGPVYASASIFVA
jgi:MFS family permease